MDGIAYQTAEADIFAGGDCVTGPRFAIDAIAAGKQGAISISRLLRGRNLTDGRNASFEAIDTDDVSVRVSRIDATPRQTAPEVDGKASAKTFKDLREGLTEEQLAARPSAASIADSPLWTRISASAAACARTAVPPAAQRTMNCCTAES